MIRIKLTNKARRRRHKKEDKRNEIVKCTMKIIFTLVSVVIEKMFRSICRFNEKTDAAFVILKMWTLDY